MNRGKRILSRLFAATNRNDNAAELPIKIPAFRNERHSIRTVSFVGGRVLLASHAPERLIIIDATAWHKKKAVREGLKNNAPRAARVRKLSNDITSIFARATIPRPDK